MKKLFSFPCAKHSIVVGQWRAEGRGEGGDGLKIKIRKI